MTITWGSFQSLIQLSVALNAAFAAFGSYTGTDIQKERERLSKIRNSIAEGAELPPQGINDLGGITRIIFLEGKCEEISADYINFIGGKFKTVCILFASVGIILMIYSSYFSNTSIEFFYRDISIFLICPFFYGLFRLGKLKANIYKLVTKEADAIERQIVAQLGGRVR